MMSASDPSLWIRNVSEPGFERVGLMKIAVEGSTRIVAERSIAVMRIRVSSLPKPSSIPAPTPL